MTSESGQRTADQRKARLALAATREDVEAGRWVKCMWSTGDGRGCLHTLLARNVGAATGSGYPTPVDGLVFHAVWKALELFTGESLQISAFNDAFGTGRREVLAVLRIAEGHINE